MPTLVVRVLDPKAETSFGEYLDLTDSYEGMKAVEAKQSENPQSEIRQAIAVLRPFCRLEGDDGEQLPLDDETYMAALRRWSLMEFIEAFEKVGKLNTFVGEIVPKASGGGSARASTATSTTKTLSRRNGSKSGH